MKESPNFFKIWGGIAGVQSMLPAMLVEGHVRRALSLSHIAKLLAMNVAGRFHLAGKGKIAVGYEADLVFIDLAAGKKLEAEHLHYRHRISPYIGMAVHGLVRRTILRGQTIYHDGTFFAGSARLIKPAENVPPIIDGFVP